MHKKNFKEWHERKNNLEHTESARLFFHERDVWWCCLGANIGFEQDGKGEKFARPVLVFKKFNNEVFWALPLSTRVKNGKFYALVNLPDGMPRVAILSQLRLVDARRLIDKIGLIDSKNYADIQKAVIRLCSA